MNKLRRAGISLAFRMLMLALIAAPAAAAEPAAMPEAARVAWGFDRSDLAPHPQVRFGALANGMRYALMRHERPAGGLAVRLHLSGGSSLEGPREQGYMHLIEHMIFHGSANLPEGSLPLLLKHQGLASWEDFDAYTSFDETVYRLDLGKSDAGARQTALHLMHEIAANLRFGRGAVEGAKRKVRDEIGRRDAVRDRIVAAQHAFLLPGLPLARGPVAGSDRSVARASAAALERLYRRHYVPVRATLVLVGDFDPDAAEAQVRAQFSGWSEAAPTAPDRPPSTLGERRGGDATLFVDTEAPTMVTVASVDPLDRAPDAEPLRNRQFLEHLGSALLNRRLERMAAQPDPPFAGGQAAIYDHFSAARLARVELSAKDRDWQAALRAGAGALEAALTTGFSQAELDAEIGARSRALDAQAPATASELADAIVDSVGRRYVFTDPGDTTASKAYLAGVRLTEVNAAFRRAWGDSGRLLFVSHNQALAEGALAAAWQAIQRRVAGEPRPAP